jgi:hypothetical protein
LSFKRKQGKEDQLEAKKSNGLKSCIKEEVVYIHAKLEKVNA